jgi:hypothetical protein
VGNLALFGWHLQAQHEEKAILDQCSSKLGYVSAIPQVIRKLRDFMAKGGEGTAAEGQKRHSSSPKWCQTNFPYFPAVSHQNVLLGRHADSVTLGLHRAQRVAHHKATHFAESE